MKNFAAQLLLVIISFLLSSRNGIEASTHSNNIDPIKYRIPKEQPYRTSYHFQPPQNWMNGIFFTKLCQVIFSTCWSTSI